jgi:cobalt-zinc-cadmium efflux system outer membrane protein
MKKYKLIYVCLFLLISPSVRVNGQEEMLEEYIQTAARNNPLLKARFNEYQAALQAVPQAGALPDPQVAFSYFIQPVETRVGAQQARISAVQIFPWFGTLNATKNEAIQSAKAKYEDFSEAKSNLFYQVKSAWYDLYVTRKAIDITSENIDILNSFYRLAMIKTEVGSALTVDAIRTEMEIADMENQLAFLKDTWYSQTVKFNKLLNTESTNPVDLPDKLWNTDLQYDRLTILNSIKAGNHQLVNIDFKTEALKYKEQTARRSGKPGFSLGVDYIATGEADNTMTGKNINGKDAIIFPKIGITIPLYRNKYNAMIREAVYLQQASEEKKINRINFLETIFEMTYREYNDADRRITLFSKQTVLAEKAFRILESEYTTAGADFEELLRMERKVLTYALELEKARADKQASIAFINYLTGN